MKLLPPSNSILTRLTNNLYSLVVPIVVGIRNSDILLKGLVAQWLEQSTHNRLAAGSNPAGPTIFQRP